MQIAKILWKVLRSAAKELDI